mgnify:CR=1 FL=1
MRYLLVFGAGVLALAATCNTCFAMSDYPTVSTWAGTGAAGIRDGAASQAEFVAPYGIAFDHAENLYVADAGAQRIRRISSGGIVSTLAGSGPMLLRIGVAGGYQDGPAANARFNYPTGIAVDADGTIYVADMRNHCIRRIQNGVVSTFAGNPAKRGYADGPRADATFEFPNDIAIDQQHNLYVADVPYLRKIDSSGMVSTLTLPHPAHSVSVENVDGHTLLLLGAKTGGLFVDDLATGKIEDHTNTSAWLEDPGYEYGIAALNRYEVVAADPAFSVIRLIQFPGPLQAAYYRPLTATPSVRAQTRGGGFQDGAGENALFTQPTGIAVSTSGMIAVADTGNRRIRLLSPFDDRSLNMIQLGAMPPLPAAKDPGQFSIGILGGSNVYANVSWHESIGGVLETKLANVVNPRLRVRAYPIPIQGGFGMEAGFSGLNELYCVGELNELVFMFPGWLMSSSEASINRAASALKNSNKICQANRTRLLVVLSPQAFELPYTILLRKIPFYDSNNLLYDDRYALDYVDPQNAYAHYQASLAAARRSRVDYVDLWPAFLNAIANRSGPLYFNIWDVHFTAAGATLMGNLIADALAKRLKAER